MGFGLSNLHAQPESALSTRSRCLWMAVHHLGADSSQPPGDLLHISLLHWASEAQGGPPGYHTSSSQPPWGRANLHSLPVVLLGSSQSPFNTHSPVDLTHTQAALDQVRQTDYISYIINPPQGPLLPPHPVWWRSSFST